jgi:hypothetical protein
MGFFKKCSKLCFFKENNCFQNSNISLFVESCTIFTQESKLQLFYSNSVLTKVERSGENLRCHAGEKLEDFETHFRIKWC